MAEQLTIFGNWEAVVPEPLAAPEPPAPSEPPPPPPPIDPRQVDLLSGPQTMRAALEDACKSLDADAVRARHVALTRSFANQHWAERAADWASGIEWLVGRPAGSLSVEDEVARALDLRADHVAATRFPSLVRYLLAAVRSESLRRAGARLSEARGPLARAPNGEPAGWLLLVAGDAEGARAQLAGALLAAEREAVASVDAFPLGRTWSWLAEAEWLAGDTEAALAAYVRACLRGGAVTEPDITCIPILDLFDAATDLELPEPIADWIPVVADLLGSVRLPPEAVEVPAGALAPRKLAAGLALYRKARATAGFDENARMDAKRKLIKLAPETLRELLRKI